MTMKSSSAFKPCGRELVFDIDMDDYSPVYSVYKILNVDSSLLYWCKHLSKVLEVYE